MGDKVLWYRQPAKTWLQGMPIGNGRLGAMIQGKLRSESIALNEDTVWAKVAEDRNNEDSRKYLSEIRQMLVQGNFEQAQALAELAMIGTPKNQPPYQMLGELTLLFPNHCDDSMDAFRQECTLQTSEEASKKRVTDYRRELNLQTATAHVGYTLDGVEYRRDFFASRADQAIVAKLTASKSGSLSLYVKLFRQLDAHITTEGDHQLLLQGRCGELGTRFCALLSVEANGGTITPIGEGLAIDGADEIVLRLTAETDLRSADYVTTCRERMSALEHADYNTLRERHLREYRPFFEAMNLELDDCGNHLSLPTDERLARLRNGERDLDLVALYFSFGRYLLISSSRPDSAPANLQGIWCDSLLPEWDSKYTININTQMNYWPAEMCGLSACHLPLFNLLEGMRKNGRVTAEKMYGCKGFVAHHNTDIWCDTAPLGHTRAGIWPMGAAWLCFHMWEHYRYHPDQVFLRDVAYPVMKESAEFFLDYLTEGPDGRLMSDPSISPENRFLTSDGQIGCMCMSPAMNVQIVSGLFEHCLEAAQHLCIQDDFTQNVEKALHRLPDMKIGSQGQLLEWQEEYTEIEPEHRHLSHLFAVYPGRQFTRDQKPELYAAAKRSLELRQQAGSGSTGWSAAWIIALWAQFGEGNQAERMLQKLLCEMTADSLLDMHPPRIFQIDGNLGATAGIAEMLVQSDEEQIILFPALPDDWQVGGIKGMCIVGGATLDVSWRKREYLTIALHADQHIKKKLLVGTERKLLTASLDVPCGSVYKDKFQF